MIICLLGFNVVNLALLNNTIGSKLNLIQNEILLLREEYKTHGR